jgi:hypothetical protein
MRAVDPLPERDVCSLTFSVSAGDASIVGLSLSA